jgi:serine/threonine-protein kinase
MTDERWQTVRTLFEAVVERPVEERAAYLKAVTVGDEPLRAEVETLLLSDDVPNPLLDQSGVLGHLLDSDVAAALLPPNGLIAGEPLAPGVRVGPYEVGRLLGSGAMGQVYQARHVTLHRDVALKVLPKTFANDRERLARLKREAQLLAAVNHRNIAAVFGYEESDGIHAIVLELVEGPTLAERIAGGPLALHEALAIARQIASALEAAHDKGIIHRDPKPANVIVCRDGVAKVLDFGLAKAGDTADPSLLSASPNVTAVDGFDRTILGTPAYMSPEQVRGQPLDRRTDMWSFGCVLYEMLTGRRAFAGETISDTMAAILEHRPDFSILPADVPPAIAGLLRRCLEKRRENRLDSAAVARLEIEEALESPAVDARSVLPRRSRTARIAAMTLFTGVAALAIAAAWTLIKPTPVATQTVTRFTIVPPPEPALNVWGSVPDIAMSPDGRHLVYRAGGTWTGGSPLMVRAMDRLDAQPIPNITFAYAPFFSPDNEWVGFFEKGLLKKVAIGGGPVVTLCEIAGAPLGATWGDDNVITFATGLPIAGLWRVRADGGEPTVLIRPDGTHQGETYGFPSELPHRIGVLFTVMTPGPAGGSQIAVLDATGRRKTLIQGGSDAHYLEPGHLVFATAGTLRTVRFDPDQLEVVGDPVTTVEDVLVKSTGAADYTLSRDGTLVYIPAAVSRSPLRALVWVDRRGHEEPLQAPVRAYGPGRISPDGTRIAMGIQEDGHADVWMMDVHGGALKRLTNSPDSNGLPLWTPDGRQIVFSMANESGVLNLYRRQIDGRDTLEPITTSRIPFYPTSFMPDGTHVFGFELEPQAPPGVVVVPFSKGTDNRNDPGVADGLKPLFAGAFAEISPNGRYLAYQTSDSAQPEVCVRPFPDVQGGPWQISNGGGTRPAWSRNGHELFFLDGSNALMVASVDTSGPAFVGGAPSKLFDGKYVEPNPSRHYDVSPDGQRFLMLKDSAAGGSVMPVSMVAVLNWREELNRLTGKR